MLTKVGIIIFDEPVLAVFKDGIVVGVWVLSQETAQQQ